ncbi:hypothetical protein [Xylophilus sp.]|uniref:hypothetical protein n=1 Tax=Xylophilus sp. TaxID=2653893 RepID=UPI0013B9DBE4|nr:hypothetical protein [Xylophilus sp.]KAF1047410.1 MAG: hypothetical protein GAK38_01929 [Xylophilus sp.]
MHLRYAPYRISAQYDLLIHACRMQLPLALEQSDVDLVRTYVAAGLVVAQLPPSQREALHAAPNVPARITAITPRGHATARMASKGRRT